MPKPWENAEGYHDPTAYHGTKNIIRDEDEQQKRVNTLIFVLKYITRLAGFELLNRIEIKDRKTGRPGGNTDEKRSFGSWGHEIPL
jgi:hypothetical protein